MSDPNRNIDLIAKGDSAKHSSILLKERLYEQEDNIIQRAINHLKSGTLTGEVAISTIGQIAALRQLEESIETDIRKGIVARQEEYKNDGS